MIGLDTNILVRYLAQDDPVQSPKARELIEQQLTEENPGFLSVVVMAETVWVLDRAYGLADHAIAAVIVLKEGHGSFADALIGGLGIRAGCSRTLTFDQKASRLPGFELL
jgi:predicted nucleic-acid-binding protein